MVWLGKRSKEKYVIKQVQKVTPKRIYISQTLFFDKQRGRQTYSGLNEYYLTGLASEEDIRQYNLASEKQHEEYINREKEREFAAKKRTELYDLFPEKTVIINDASVEGMCQLWSVEFKHLTEDRVRKLAEFLKHEQEEIKEELSDKRIAKTNPQNIDNMRSYIEDSFILRGRW